MKREYYKEIRNILSEYLQDNRKTIDIKECIITETDYMGSTSVECFYEFSDEKHDNPNSIRTHGDGFVDALVAGFIDRFEEDYKSLKNMRLSRYEVRARIKRDFDVSRDKPQSQADADVVVELGIKTPSSDEVLFIEKDSSVVRASTKIVRNAIQFLINCEEAVKVVHVCLQDAQSRGRMDMVDKYTSDLIELVKLTSYEEILN